MQVNLYDASGEILAEYFDVIEWGANFVEYITNGYRSKVYCDPTAGEIFAEVTDEATEADYQAALAELGVQLNEKA